MVHVMAIWTMIQDKSMDNCFGCVVLCCVVAVCNKEWLVLHSASKRTSGPGKNQGRLGETASSRTPLSSNPKHHMLFSYVRGHIPPHPTNISHGFGPSSPIYPLFQYPISPYFPRWPMTDRVSQRFPPPRRSLRES